MNESNIFDVSRRQALYGSHLNFQYNPAQCKKSVMFYEDLAVAAHGVALVFGL